MPKIGNSISASEALCERCGSKKRVSKRWVEKIQISNGTTTIQHEQIVCTNRECQSKFEKIFLDEREKREKLKQTKLERITKKISPIATK